jgi:microcystin degradation protein MlrC
MSRPLRIAIGRFMQETNSFSPVLTTRADFERTHWVVGEALLKACHPKQWEVKGFLKNLELSGFVRVAQALGPVEIIPLTSAWSISGGPLAADFFEATCQQFEAQLQSAGPLDGVFLALHGAMGVVGIQDPEAELLRRMRRVVEPHTQFAVSFDLHGLLTPEKVALVDILCAYHTNPHRDMARTGERAARLLIGALRGELQPTVAWRSLPMISGGGNTLDFSAPMRACFQLMKRWLEDPRVLDSSLFMAHPYLEHPDLGWSVYVATQGDQDLAESLADELAEGCWEVRAIKPPAFISAAEAVAEVRQARWQRRAGAVAICDVSDVVGAGGTGENTHLLQALLTLAPDLRTLYPLRDPVAVAELWEHPEGTVLTIPVGGRLHPEMNPALEVVGTVRRKTTTDNFGRSVHFDLGGVQLVLTEGYAMPMKPSFYEDMGLSVRGADMVIVKNFFHFRLYYATRCFKNLYVYSKGITDFDVSLQVATRYPVHPKEEVSDWRAIDRLRRGVETPPPAKPVHLRRSPKRWLLPGALLAGAAALTYGWFRRR